MLFNYTLAKRNIPTVQLNRCDLANYFEARDKCLATNTILPLYDFAEKLLLGVKTQDKSYYKNLQPLTLAEIHNRLLSDKSMLWERFKVKHIDIFGSFSKGKQRIDSDVDLLVTFSLDLTNDEKTQNIQKMAEHYFYVFGRFVDINEVGEYLSNELVKETSTHKRVF